MTNMERILHCLLLTAGLFARACNGETSGFIVQIDGALNHHDYTILEQYIDSPINYFGRKDTSPSYIAADMRNDSRIYTICRSKYNPGSFEHSSLDSGLTRDSIELQRYVLETSGKEHRAHCRFIVEYSIKGDVPKIRSLQLQVLPWRQGEAFSKLEPPVGESQDASAQINETPKAVRPVRGFWSPEMEIERKVQGVGTNVTFGGCEYTITGYKTLRTYGDMQARPDKGAVFVWLTFTARNISESTKRVYFDSFDLADEFGKKYKRSLKGPIFEYEEIQPGLSRTGESLFEVPADAIGKPMYFLLSDESGSDKQHLRVPLPGITEIENEPPAVNGDHSQARERHE
ncbi:MAG: DUF4352 domain-containing protein [Verrucomicrobia bacterium]|nr:DUF4352 domain-containing protein [Verrucomicrobiota bacterium]